MVIKENEISIDNAFPMDTTPKMSGSGAAFVLSSLPSIPEPVQKPVVAPVATPEPTKAQASASTKEAVPDPPKRTTNREPLHPEIPLPAPLIPSMPDAPDDLQKSLGF